MRGDSKTIKEMAGIFESVYGVKFTIETLDSLEDLHKKMLLARETTPEDIGSWLGLHYNYYTINGSTLLQGSDGGRFPDINISDLEGFCHQHKLDELPKLFR